MKECSHKSLSFNVYYKTWNCQFCEKPNDLEVWRQERALRKPTTKPNLASGEVLDEK